MLKKILFSTHRILGTILSILFLMWFLSGFFMIYHTFPRVSNEDRFTHMDVLQHENITSDSLYRSLADSTMFKLSLKSHIGVPSFELISAGRVQRLSADSCVHLLLQPSYYSIEQYAQKWVQTPIAKVDTLYNLDQWIPFNRLRKDFPIYKFHFNDDAKHQLYISSMTGEALQFTNQSSRIWAWLGAIPHWVYFTSLRQDTATWSDVVIFLSALGCIMCIVGIIAGIWVYAKQRCKKNRKGLSPYRKFAYKWHHITGFVFGVFVFTFTFSGMMSLADLPEWIVKVHNKELRQKMYTPQTIDINNYVLDYHKVLEAYPNQIKSIEWATFGSKPLYKVIIGNQMITIDASTDEVNALLLNDVDIKKYISAIHSESFSILSMTEFDNYYIGKGDRFSLPIYKIEVEDADNSTYYINPKNASVHYFNNNARAHKWMYQGLHSYKLKFLEERPILWNIVMWLTMIGGTLVSATGVWLAYRYVRRKIRRFKKKAFDC